MAMIKEKLRAAAITVVAIPLLILGAILMAAMPTIPEADRTESL